LLRITNSTDRTPSLTTAIFKNLKLRSPKLSPEQTTKELSPDAYTLLHQSLWLVQLLVEGSIIKPTHSADLLLAGCSVLLGWRPDGAGATDGCVEGTNDCYEVSSVIEKRSKIQISRDCTGIAREPRSMIDGCCHPVYYLTFPRLEIRGHSRLDMSWLESGVV
jgi:hypothetical protein